jgi:uncharacterized protein
MSESKMKKAILVWGGWMGHEPDQCTAIFAPYLESQGYAVEVFDNLDIYLDTDKLLGLDLIVPVWTMGTITRSRKRAC